VASAFIGREDLPFARCGVIHVRSFLFFPKTRFHRTSYPTRSPPRAVPSLHSCKTHFLAAPASRGLSFFLLLAGALFSDSSPRKVRGRAPLFFPFSRYTPSPGWVGREPCASGNRPSFSTSKIPFFDVQHKRWRFFFFFFGAMDVRDPFLGLKSAILLVPRDGVPFFFQTVSCQCRDFFSLNFRILFPFRCGGALPPTILSSMTPSPFPTAPLIYKEAPTSFFAFREESVHSFFLSWEKNFPGKRCGRRIPPSFLCVFFPRYGLLFFFFLHEFLRSLFHFKLEIFSPPPIGRLLFPPLQGVLSSFSPPFAAPFLPCLGRISPPI